VDPNLTPGAVAACRRADIIPVSPDLLAEASKLDPRGLRSLDAIHLASALRLANAGLDAFVGYDQRLLQAASDAGLPTASPGS
jgi:predicted nucleic acid-binding protein